MLRAAKRTPTILSVHSFLTGYWALWNANFKTPNSILLTSSGTLVFFMGTIAMALQHGPCIGGA